MCAMKICVILTANWCGNIFMQSKQGLLRPGKKQMFGKGAEKVEAGEPEMVAQIDPFIACNLRLLIVVFGLHT